MSQARPVLLGVVGGIAVLAGVFGAIAPPPFLGSSGLLVCGILFLVGLGMIGGAIALYHKAKITTVTIAMGRQAEKDAAALTKMEFAVGRGESAESVVPKQRKEKLVVPPEVFAHLENDQAQYQKEAKKTTPKKEKTKPVVLPKEILKVAKRTKKKKK